MFLGIMAYSEYENICQGDSVMSRGVITIITISDTLPSGRLLRQHTKSVGVCKY